MARDQRVVAIGEIGLDFYRDLSPRDTQRQAFREQIKMAQEIGKPIVILTGMPIRRFWRSSRQKKPAKTRASCTVILADCRWLRN
jgi:Tat protein secretion system quality control protein TatD with DNase activity